MTKRGTLYDAHAAGLQHDNYPEIPDDEQLFDRGRVADIITGEFRE